MTTNKSQYIFKHLTDQSADISLFAHLRAPEASLQLNSSNVTAKSQVCLSYHLRDPLSFLYT